MYRISKLVIFYVGGGLRYCICCGGGGCRGLSGILGVSILLFDMYFALSVLLCGCLLHGLGQFWLQRGWQNNFSTMCNVFFLQFYWGFIVDLEFFT